MMNFQEQFQKAREAAFGLIEIEETKRRKVLETLSHELQEAVPLILGENAKDLQCMDACDPRYDRLFLNESRIVAIAEDVAKVAAFDSPLQRTLEERTRPNGLRLQKVTVPLGVVGVIYESRPNVTIDIFSLCFKAGNVCLLKGGKEADFSNRVLVSLIHRALETHGLKSTAAILLPPSREATQALLHAEGYVDVCIPRGSQSLINAVRENARVPVIETGAGIVHTYFDKSADLAKGKAIVENAKTRRVSVCNALDCLLLHEARLGDLPQMTAPLAAKGVEIFADGPSFEILKAHYPSALLHEATPESFGQEFLSLKISIKTVASVEVAMKHIQRYSSKHSEAIIAEDKSVIDKFLNLVDAAAVYVNASTAFTDGGEFGMGAEIGISTQKLHARGPMALEALTSYKWMIFGDGHVRA